MDTHWQRTKRFSIAGETPYSSLHYGAEPIGDVSNSFKQPFPQQQSVPTVRTRSSYYESHYPLYQCDWTNSKSSDTGRIALSSYREDTTNRLQVVYSFPDYSDSELAYDADGVGRAKILGFDIHKIAETSVNYPVTRLQWDPSMRLGTSQTERLATTSECLRIYEVSSSPENGNGPYRLTERVALSNSKTKNLNQLPPLTSFDWSVVDPKLIITCSVDTTCTLWDLTKGAAKTQLIAHDSEVYDVKFLFGDKNVFTSCSNDGSVRVFDLRSLEHSTIIYEPQTAKTKSTASSVAMSPVSYNPDESSDPTKSTPLLRLATSNYNANHVATVESRGNKVIVLDLRYPGVPIKTLAHHQAPINSMEWHPTKNWLLTGSDDCQAFVYDLNELKGRSVKESSSSSSSSSSDISRIPRSSSRPRTTDLYENMAADLPAFAYSGDIEINNVTWDADGDWAGVVGGKGFQAVRIQ